MYSVSAKIVKPPGEKPDEFEATISLLLYGSKLPVLWLCH